MLAWSSKRLWATAWKWTGHKSNPLPITCRGQRHHYACWPTKLGTRRTSESSERCSAPKRAVSATRAANTAPPAVAASHPTAASSTCGPSPARSMPGASASWTVGGSLLVILSFSFLSFSFRCFTIQFLKDHSHLIDLILWSFTVSTSNGLTLLRCGIQLLFWNPNSICVSWSLWYFLVFVKIRLLFWDTDACWLSPEVLHWIVALYWNTREGQEKENVQEFHDYKKPQGCRTFFEECWSVLSQMDFKSFTILGMPAAIYWNVTMQKRTWNYQIQYNIWNLSAIGKLKCSCNDKEASAVAGSWANAARDVFLPNFNSPPGRYGVTASRPEGITIQSWETSWA